MQNDNEYTKTIIHLRNCIFVIAATMLFVALFSPSLKSWIIEHSNTREGEIYEQ